MILVCWNFILIHLTFTESRGIASSGIRIRRQSNHSNPLTNGWETFNDVPELPVKHLRPEHSREHRQGGKLCSSEQSFLPASKHTSTYTTLEFDATFVEQVIHTFLYIIERNTIGLIHLKDNVPDLDEHDLFSTNNHLLCADTILGHAHTESVVNDFPHLKGTLLEIVVLKIEQGNVGLAEEFYCLAHGTAHRIEYCQEIVAAWEFKVESATPMDLKALPVYPAYFFVNNKSITTYSNQTITCSDPVLKSSTLLLYQNYEKMMAAIETISRAYTLNITLLNCDYKLSNFSYEEIRNFIKCTIMEKRARRSVIGEAGSEVPHSHTNSTNVGVADRPRRYERDLLSWLGIRDDLSEFVKEVNMKFRANFDQINEHENVIINAINKEVNIVHKFLEEESREVTNIARVLAYDRIGSRYAKMMQFYRNQRVSTFHSMATTLQLLTQKFNLLINLGLSPRLGNEGSPFCYENNCFDPRSILIKRNNGRVKLIARKIDMEMIETVKLSCYIFVDENGQIVKHPLDNNELIMVDNQLVDRDTRHIVSDTCIEWGEDCGKSPAVVKPEDLLGGLVFLSFHDEKLFCQCPSNQTVLTKAGNISCTMEPQNIELPFILNTQPLTRVTESRVHLYVSAFRKIDVLDEVEKGLLEDRKDHPLDDLWDSVKNIPNSGFNVKEPKNWGIAAGAVGIMIIGAYIMCCCPGKCRPWDICVKFCECLIYPCQRKIYNIFRPQTIGSGLNKEALHRTRKGANTDIARNSNINQGTDGDRENSLPIQSSNDGRQNAHPASPSQSPRREGCFRSIRRYIDGFSLREGDKFVYLNPEQQNKTQADFSMIEEQQTAPS